MFDIGQLTYATVVQWSTAWVMLVLLMQEVEGSNPDGDIEGYCFFQFLFSSLNNFTATPEAYANCNNHQRTTK